MYSTLPLCQSLSVILADVRFCQEELLALDTAVGSPNGSHNRKAKLQHRMHELAELAHSKWPDSDAMGSREEFYIFLKLKADIHNIAIKCRDHE